MLHIVETKKSVQEVEKDFPEVAGKHKFGVLGVYNLRQKMNVKGVCTSSAISGIFLA
jgi:putative heme iron utilization protein